MPNGNGFEPEVVRCSELALVLNRLVVQHDEERPKPTGRTGPSPFVTGRQWISMSCGMAVRTLSDILECRKDYVMLSTADNILSGIDMSHLLDDEIEVIRNPLLDWKGRSMVDPEELEQGKPYKFKMRTQVGDGSVVEWEVRGTWGGRSRSVGGRFSYTIAIVPFTTFHYVHPGRDDIVGVNPLESAYKKVDKEIESVEQVASHTI